MDGCTSVRFDSLMAESVFRRSLFPGTPPVKLVQTRGGEAILTGVDSDRLVAIETIGLARSFGDLMAVDHIDLSVDQGELFSLLGPNGAGKTTTIKMLCCLTRPTGGTATVMGRDIESDALSVKEVIAVSPQETAIDGNLNAWENLALMAGLHGLGKSETKARSGELLELMGLTERQRSG